MNAILFENHNGQFYENKNPAIYRIYRYLKKNSIQYKFATTLR